MSWHTESECAETRPRPEQPDLYFIKSRKYVARPTLHETALIAISSIFSY